MAPGGLSGQSLRRTDADGRRAKSVEMTFHRRVISSAVTNTNSKNPWVQILCTYVLEKGQRFFTQVPSGGSGDPKSLNSGYSAPLVTYFIAPFRRWWVKELQCIPLKRLTVFFPMKIGYTSCMAHIQGCDLYKYFGSSNQIQNQIRLVILVLTDTKIWYHNFGKWQILYLRTRYRSKLGWFFWFGPIHVTIRRNLDYLRYRMFFCLPDFPWANWNRDELAKQLGKIAEHPCQSQPYINPAAQLDAPPCIMFVLDHLFAGNTEYYYCQNTVQYNTVETGYKVSFCIEKNSLICGFTQ